MRMSSAFHLAKLIVTAAITIYSNMAVELYSSVEIVDKANCKSNCDF